MKWIKERNVETYGVLGKCLMFNDKEKFKNQPFYCLKFNSILILSKL